MVDKVDVTVTNLEKKHKGKAGYENRYSVAKYVYMDNGEVETIGFAIDKDNLRILRAKIDVMLIDDDKPSIKKKMVVKMTSKCKLAYLS